MGQNQKLWWYQKKTKTNRYSSRSPHSSTARLYQGFVDQKRIFCFIVLTLFFLLIMVSLDSRVTICTTLLSTVITSSLQNVVLWNVTCVNNQRSIITDQFLQQQSPLAALHYCDSCLESFPYWLKLKPCIEVQWNLSDADTTDWCHLKCPYQTHCNTL